MKPTIKMLKESAPRSGFFEGEQYESVLTHLPDEIRPVITFAYLSGWRIASEVLTLEWRSVDFARGEIRLDAANSKNEQGRVLPMNDELRTMLVARYAEHERLKASGVIMPHVFFRMIAKGRG